MSIIHDALKKVQQSLTPKTSEPPTPPSGTDQKGATYLYATPPSEETIEHLEPQTASPKKSSPNKIKSFLAFLCAIAITAGSIWYLYHQFQDYIPRLQRTVKKSYYQLIHKEEVPDFKTKKPEDLVPLAKITINPPASSTAANTTTPAPAPLPTTLNVHGIMANASGNLALINNRVYQEGDEVDGAKIIKINLDSITVNIDGTEKTIYVNN
jgi:hypothetical protein